MIKLRNAENNVNASLNYGGIALNGRLVRGVLELKFESCANDKEIEKILKLSAALEALAKELLGRPENAPNVVRLKTPPRDN